MPTSARLIGCALVAALSLLAGCGGDPADPPATPSPSSTSPSTPVVPTLPPEAQQDTRAGAVAFVKHYIELINHAQKTGDTEPMRAASADTCDSCSKTTKSLDQLYSAGGHLEGGQWHLSAVEASERPQAKSWLVFARVTYEPQVVVRLNDQKQHLSAGQGSVDFVVSWSNGWKVSKWTRGS